MKNKIINHPVVQAQLSIIRDKETRSQLFSSCVNCISRFLAFEASKDLKIKQKEIETPICTTIGNKIADEIVLMPILRAGLGMVEGFKSMLPISYVGHIGIYRDEESLKPIKYFSKVPNSIEGSIVMILDPMLATGGSAIEAIRIVKEHNPKEIKFICMVACPEGIKNLEEAYPDIQIICASIDQKLNDVGYIVPGLGDAGDRIFGTKEKNKNSCN